jgi:hypothetical protein
VEDRRGPEIGSDREPTFVVQPLSTMQRFHETRLLFLDGGRFLADLPATGPVLARPLNDP